MITIIASLSTDFRRGISQPLPAPRPKRYHRRRMPIQKVGVVGCGLMGSGIAQICAQKGHPTIVREINEEVLKKGMDRIRGSLAEGVKRGKATSAQAELTLNNLAGTTSLADLKDCDL